jgi:hypothetical protein
VTFPVPGIFNVCVLCRPVKERRRILEQNMKEVPNRIMFSEMKEIYVSAQSFNKNNSSYFNSREILLAIECI